MVENSHQRAENVHILMWKLLQNYFKSLKNRVYGSIKINFYLFWQTRALRIDSHSF